MHNACLRQEADFQITEADYLQASLASHSRKPVGGPKPAGDRGQQHQSSRKLNVAVDRHMNVIASTLAVENPSERHLDFLVDRVCVCDILIIFHVA